jgi:outer membrane lipoprotein-sorting protein
VVRGLRTALDAAPPQVLPFTQTFRAAGFSDGEQESGEVSLDLPRCVRWDYEEPYPKSYLLCGTELHTWNPGEPVGHLMALESTQPGLDLIVLDVDELMGRYRATAKDGAGGATVVTLTPRQEGERVLREAEIVVSADGKRPLRLAYQDADGNHTSFAFGAPRRLRSSGAFSPPSGVRWERSGS